jgi:hypothetical protein
MTNGQPKGRILRFPSAGPWEPPRWQPVRARRGLEGPSGLRQIERVVIRYVRRGWRMLRALDHASGIDMETVDDGPVLGLLALDGSWIDLLCHIARHEVGTDGLDQLALDVRRMGREQVLLRQSVYAELPPDERAAVAAAEQAEQVFDLDVRQSVVDMLVALHNDSLDEEATEDVDFGGARPPAERSRARLSEVNGAHRTAWEQRPLPARRSLSTCLRALPVVWLDGVAHAHGIEPVGPRRAREGAVAAALLDPERLRARVDALPERARTALDAVLDAGGLVPAASLSSRFGSDAADGWFWLEHPPQSPLGRLRLAGLAYVGQAEIGGDTQRAVGVPAELCAMLRPAEPPGAGPTRSRERPSGGGPSHP